MMVSIAVSLLADLRCYPLLVTFSGIVESGCNLHPILIGFISLPHFLTDECHIATLLVFKLLYQGVDLQILDAFFTLPNNLFEEYVEDTLPDLPLLVDPLAPIELYQILP